MKTSKIETYLPKFDGFYCTIWESDSKADQEIEYINEQRNAKGLPDAKFDRFEFDYSDYNMQVVKGIAAYVENVLKKEGFISGIWVQNIHSPREYNFANDSCNIEVKLTHKNYKAIEAFLITHKEAFAKYLERYTSRSGFISYYGNTIESFLDGNLQEALHHKHKLGSILEFICDELEVTSEDIYDHVEAYLSVINYDELINEIPLNEEGEPIEVEIENPNQLKLEL